MLERFVFNLLDIGEKPTASKGREGKMKSSLELELPISTPRDPTHPHNNFIRT